MFQVNSSTSTMTDTKTSDWQDDKSLSECMLYMLENEIMCDVTLRVGKDRTPIKAHKYMLSSRSPVFYTMFEWSLPETGEIDIPDVNVQTFKDLLKTYTMAETKTLDWQDHKSLSECMLYMLDNEIMCDVTLRVGEDKTPIKAHKYMLSSRSPVFYTMFEGSLPETGDIEMPDVDEETFRDLLKYMYTDEIEISNNNVNEILYVADKYMLSKVKKECGRILKDTASSQDSAKALQTAYQYHLDELQDESLSYIEKNTKKCILSEYSLYLSKECVELILKSDYLNCSETDICKFFLKWAKVQCESENIEVTGQNMRKIVDHLLYLIRFPIIDMQYFSTEIARSGLLTSDESSEIYQAHFGVKTESFLNSFRGPVGSRPNITSLRSEQISNTWDSSGKHVLSFKSDRDFWLKGVVICSPNGLQCDPFGHQPRVHISVIILDGTNKQKASHTLLLGAGSYGSSTYCINLSEPVRIISGQKYTVTITGLNCFTYYCTDCKETVSTNGVTITYENSPLQSNTDKDKGQLAGLMFSL